MFHDFLIAQSIAILLLVRTASKGSQKGGGCHEANDHNRGNGGALSGRVEPDSAFNTLLRCCNFTAILFGCCVKVRWVSSVTPNTFGLFSSGSTWSACFTCGCNCCL